MKPLAYRSILCLFCLYFGTAWSFTTRTIPRGHIGQPQTIERRHADTFLLQAQKQDDLTPNTEPQVYTQRWIQLGYLSLLALLSDWICFSVAATPEVYQTAFDHSASSLIDIFLFTNVASCFLVTDTVSKFGLETAIKAAAVLMSAGCWLRSGVSFLGATEHLVPYPLLVAGTVLVGAAQPFFQCTPPLLSAVWFAPQERATSTAVALNFNQIGIATAFLVGGAMVTSVNGMEDYFGLIAVLCTVVTMGTLVQFENEPPIPPSASELEKVLSNESEPPFVESVQRLFQTAGFSKALAAFICSISITNVVGAFIDEFMKRGGVTSQLQIDLAGAGFELAILLGGIVIGNIVDRTKAYKQATLACLAVTAASLLPLGVSSGNEPEILLIMSLLGLGLSAGPVQPINAELAVDVTYPENEIAVESVQQIGGNFVSALLVPLAEFCSRRQFDMSSIAMTGDTILLFALTGITMAYFFTFNAPLARTLADADEEGLAVASGNKR